MAHTIFNEFLNAFATQALSISGDTLRVALLPATFVANRDLHQFWADISALEITGQGYAAGGAILTGKTLSKQDASDNVKFSADDTSWIDSTLTARYAVIYQDTGNPETSVLVAAIDFGSDKSSVDGTFTIEWNEDGIFTLSQAV